ncbi:hypothetical protein BJ508DRAFT_335268 [Ascobolus immersus RN42]|uniref:Myb/SANT-like domain-containing protein n=1 Tax=Ascobolus immersus RN42 TaxID=1160509 RepID=A0A3N4HCZ7_ASCIM|nr:hypothetical protein BJ508DRAFT_335268 [Ascobolus immersus RN42]
MPPKSKKKTPNTKQTLAGLSGKHSHSDSESPTPSPKESGKKTHKQANKSRRKRSKQTSPSPALPSASPSTASRSPTPTPKSRKGRKRQEQVDHPSRGRKGRKNESETSDSEDGSVINETEEKKRRLMWTPYMTTILMKACVARLRERSDNGFKKKTWNDIVEAVREFGKVPKRDQDLVNGDRCQGKVENLKKDFDLWDHLRHNSGWEIDPITGILSGPPEQWAKEIANNARAAIFQTEPLPNQKEMEEYFASTTATGSRALLPTDENLEREQNQTPRTPASRSNPSHQPSSSKRTSVSVSDPAFERFVDVVERMARHDDVVERALSLLMEKYGNGKEKESGTWWSQRSIFQGIDLLEDPHKAMAFLAIPNDEDRDVWFRLQLERLYPDEYFGMEHFAP